MTIINWRRYQKFYILVIIYNMIRSINIYQSVNFYQYDLCIQKFKILIDYL